MSDHLFRALLGALLFFLVPFLAPADASAGEAPARDLLPGTKFTFVARVRVARHSWGVRIGGGVFTNRHVVMPKSCYLQRGSPADEPQLFGDGHVDLPRELVVTKVRTISGIPGYVAFTFGEEAPFASMTCQITDAKSQLTVDQLQGVLSPFMRVSPKLPALEAPPPVATTKVPAGEFVSKYYCETMEKGLRDDYARLRVAREQKLAQGAAFEKEVRDEHVAPAVKLLRDFVLSLDQKERAALAAFASRRGLGVFDRFNEGEKLYALVAPKLEALRARVPQYMCMGDRRTRYVRAPNCFLTQSRSDWIDGPVSLGARIPRFQVSVCDSVYNDVNLRERFRFCASVNLLEGFEGALPDVDQLTAATIASSDEGRSLQPEAVGTLDEFLARTMPEGCADLKRKVAGAAGPCPGLQVKKHP